MDLERLKEKLRQHAARVSYKYELYDEKEQDPRIGFVIPPHIRWQYTAVMGWCAKAVDSLADRLVFRKFKNDTFSLNEIFKTNNPDIFFDSAILSALIGSCSFVYISRGKDGEARLQVVESSQATGEIDPITGLLKSGYAVLDRDKESGNPTLEAYFLPGRTIYYKNGKIFDEYRNKTELCTLVPIIHCPDAVRPFGRSRISRAAIYFQQHAKRTLERADVCAEFYSFPQKYVLGLSSDAEPLDTWRATVSSMLRFDKDGDGDHPILGQFSTPSMTPFSEHLKTLASGFAAETGLTLDDLGFSTDNPSSAEAIKAGHETLKLMARKAQRCFGSGFLNAGYVARCLEDDFPYSRGQLAETVPSWYPIFEPDAASLSGLGDAVVKINNSIPECFKKEDLSELTGLDLD